MAKRIPCSVQRTALQPVENATVETGARQPMEATAMGGSTKSTVAKDVVQECSSVSLRKIVGCRSSVEWLGVSSYLS